MERRSPLQIQAYDYLKNMILSGQLEPNVLYSETRMSAQIGISRTPMREAIQCLSQDGYITVVPSKGFMIRSLNEQDMEESIQIRCAIEGFCVRLIAAEAGSKKGQKTLADLDRLLEKQEKLLNQKNGPGRENIENNSWTQASLDQFMEYDHQFHRTLVSYAQNREFQQIFQRLMYLIHLTTSEALLVPGRTEDTLKEHRLVCSYLKEGDGESAYKLMMVHLLMPLTMHLTGEPASPPHKPHKIKCNSSARREIP